MNSVLIVAEKPSVAKAIVKALAIKYGLKFKRKKGKTKYNAIFTTSLATINQNKDQTESESAKENYKTVIAIKCETREQPFVLTSPEDQIIVTSVIGHIYNFDYPPPYDKESDWSLTDPEELLTKEPIEKPINEQLVEQLVELGEQVNLLSIATDFDGHGESIGWQIARTCRRKNQNLMISRMRFTATNVGAIINAFENQTTLDKGWIDQIDTLRRQDLKMGASVTRLLTVGIQKRIKSRRLISYGPCQTAVLWLIANKYEEKSSFLPKKYWKYQAIFLTESNLDKKKENNKEWTFNWKGEEFYDEKSFNEHMMARFRQVDDHIITEGKIKECQTALETFSRPTPLDTDTLESECSRLFQVSPKTISDIAEQLYNHGYITYPRTESSWYHEKDFSSLIEKFLDVKTFRNFAQDCLMNGNPSDPKQGRYTKDHEPIRPVKAATLEEIQATIPGSSFQKYLATRIYDYVVRRFLATVHRDATLQVVKLTLEVKDLMFTWEGQTIQDAGYLQHYPYKRIRTEAPPTVEEGQTIPIRIQKIQGWIYPPTLWSESELIKEMARLGIGTDATRSTHINTVLEREYVRYSGSGRKLVPTSLGYRLYKTLTSTAEELILPEIRSRVEKLTMHIRTREKSIAEVEDIVTEITRKAIQNIKSQDNEVFSDLIIGIQEMEKDPTFLGYCRECQSPLNIKKTAQGGRWLQCENEDCGKTYPLPQKGDLEILPDTCRICGGFPFLVGDGTKSWIFCPKCWMDLKDGKEPYFCSKCTETTCPYSASHRQSDFIPRGKFGTCPSCNKGEVIFQFHGTMTKVSCSNPDCNAEWNKTPNIRRGTTIRLSDECRLCGLKTILVKRAKKSPYNMCIFCDRFCFECEFRCFD